MAECLDRKRLLECLPLFRLIEVRAGEEAIVFILVSSSDRTLAVGTINSLRKALPYHLTSLSLFFETPRQQYVALKLRFTTRE